MGFVRDFPKRYVVVFLGFWSLLVSVGMRSCFTIVMVHVIKDGSNDTTGDSIFPDCTANGSSDLSLPWHRESVSLLYTAYFCGSIITQVPGGILAAAISPKRICGFSILITSVLFLIMPYALTFDYGLVMFIRISQGLAEGVSIPALNGVISSWAPKSERGRLMTFVFAGAYISPAIAMFTAGFTTCYISWNTVFFIYGGAGMVWFLLWTFFVYDRPANHPNLGEDELKLFLDEGSTVTSGTNVLRCLPWRKVITSLPVSAVFVGSFCRNWIFAFLTTEQQQYIEDSFHKNIASIGFWAAWPHIAMAFSVIVGGMITDHIIKRGYVSTTVGRKLAQAFGFGCEATAFLALGFVHDFQTSVIVMTVGVGLSGFAISGYQVNPLDLAPQYAAFITAFARLGTLGSIISTAVAGKLTSGENVTIQNWFTVLYIAAAIHYAGVIYYAIFASGEKQPWADIQEEPDRIQDDYEARQERRGLLTRQATIQQCGS